MRYLYMLLSLTIALVLAGCERNETAAPATPPPAVAPEAAPYEDLVKTPGSTEPPAKIAPAPPADEAWESEAGQLWQRAKELAEEARNRAEEAWRVGQEEGGVAWERAKETAAGARERAEIAWKQAREFSGDAWEDAQARAEDLWEDIRSTWAHMTEEAEETGGEPEPPPAD